MAGLEITQKINKLILEIDSADEIDKQKLLNDLIEIRDMIYEEVV